MRILLHSLNHSPELTGIGKYSGEMVAWLAARGHEARVVTAPPYYPAWWVDAPYSSGRYRVEKGESGSTIYRCPLYVRAVPSDLRRMLHLFSFALSSLPVLVHLAAFRQAILDLLQNGELRLRMGIAARRYAERFLGKESILRSFESSLQACSRAKTPETKASNAIASSAYAGQDA